MAYSLGAYYANRENHAKLLQRTMLPKGSGVKCTLPRYKDHRLKRIVSHSSRGDRASAGGLEALTAILRALPTDIALAFILIQHLDPKRRSILPELLSKATTIPVVETTDAMKIESNRVYVMPSKVDTGECVATGEGAAHQPCEPG